jgi:hypothetical protein
MLIKNFGHLWERKFTNYGRGGVKGHLQGYVSPQSNIIDFREQIGVYVLYDKDFMPVYVGQAGNGNAKLFARLKQHETDHLWNRWQSFSWYGIRGVNQNGSLSANDNARKMFKSNGKGLLDEFEAILITALEPKLNKQGQSGKTAMSIFKRSTKPWRRSRFTIFSKSKRLSKNSLGH